MELERGSHSHRTEMPPWQLPMMRVLVKALRLLSIGLDKPRVSHFGGMGLAPQQDPTSCCGT